MANRSQNEWSKDPCQCENTSNIIQWCRVIKFLCIETSMTVNNTSWAIEEFGDANLGDKRLTKRLVKIVDSLSKLPESSINQACGSWKEAKAAYRFFQNEKVEVDEISLSHQSQTIKRIERHKTVLAIQDTSYFSYTQHEKTSGLGLIAGKPKNNKNVIKSKGLIMHTSFAVSTKGLPLGVLEQKIYAREEKPEDSEDIDKKKRNNALPIEEKESIKWLNSLSKSQELLQSSNTRLVTVCDREADIYDLFECAHKKQSSLLVRAAQDRAINRKSTHSKKNKCMLWKFVESTPKQGEVQVNIPAQRGRPARQAILEVRFCPITMNPPKSNVRTKTKNLPNLKLYAIQVIEKNPPADVDALEWVLLTDIKISTLDSALEKVKWYCLRWRIEIFHKILKSGLRVEDCRLSSADRLIRYLTLMSIIAYRIYFTTLIARTNPNLPCDVILTEGEWKVLYSRIHQTKDYPDKIPPVKDAVKWIAQLGGFLARKNDGQPGTITIWRGWKRLMDLYDGWVLANEL